jgi:hypothetical protein
LEELGSENDVLLARIAMDSVRLGELEVELGAARLRAATVEDELAKLEARYETDTGSLRHRLEQVKEERLGMEELLRPAGRRTVLLIRTDDGGRPGAAERIGGHRYS